MHATLKDRRLHDNEEAIAESCKLDIGKPTFESYLTESSWLKNDIIFVCDNLAKWMKDEKAPDIELANKLMSPKIRKDPLGSVLVIGYEFWLELERELGTDSLIVPTTFHSSFPWGQ